jgi:hypothetical protein
MSRVQPLAESWSPEDATARPYHRDPADLRAGALRLRVGRAGRVLGELLIAVGWYRTVCTLCNGLDLPVEGWMRPWPGSAS